MFYNFYLHEAKFPYIGFVIVSTIFYIVLLIGGFALIDMSTNDGNMFTKMQIISIDDKMPKVRKGGIAALGIFVVILGLTGSGLMLFDASRKFLDTDEAKTRSEL